MDFDTPRAALPPKADVPHDIQLKIQRIALLKSRVEELGGEIKAFRDEIKTLTDEVSEFMRQFDVLTDIKVPAAPPIVPRSISVKKPPPPAPVRVAPVRTAPPIQSGGSRAPTPMIPIAPLPYQPPVTQVRQQSAPIRYNFVNRVVRRMPPLNRELIVNALTSYTGPMDPETIADFIMEFRKGNRVEAQTLEMKRQTKKEGQLNMSDTSDFI